MPSALLTVDEARARLLAAVEPVAGVDVVPLGRALGRVVAAPLLARCDVPPADNSAMDGFAIRCADLAVAGGALPIAGRMAAGQRPTELAAGTAMRILTGAVVPRGADAVVPLEDTEVVGDVVWVRSNRVVPGAHIRPAGEDVSSGAVVLPVGRKVRPQDVGLAASVGATHLEVGHTLRAAVVASGDELVEPGVALEPGQLYDSNGPMLGALLVALGCELVHVRRIADDLETTITALREVSADADLVLSSGGVSVGDEDHLKAAVRALGTIDVWRVAIQPGKPIGFGRVAGVPWLGLPGNPVSGLVTFLVFGVPLIRRLQGREPHEPLWLPMAAGFSREHANRREEYVRVSVRDGRLVPYPNQGSGVLSSAAWGDGLARIPSGAVVHEGDVLAYVSYSELLG